MCCKECAEIAKIEPRDIKYYSAKDLRVFVYKKKPEQFTLEYLEKAKRLAEKEDAKLQAILEEERQRHAGFTHVGIFDDNIFCLKRLPAKLVDDLLYAELTFKFEPSNSYDPDAVAVFYEDRKIGYLFKGFVRDMVSEALEEGWLLEARVNYVKDLSDPTEDWHKPLSFDVDIWKPK